MNSDMLPIGSVVVLRKDSKVKFMIVGFFPTNEAKERRDYTAIRYPMGVYDNRMFFFFNDSDIHEVLHKGYIDDEFEIMKELIANSQGLSIERKSN